MGFYEVISTRLMMKAELMAHLKEHPEYFEEAVQLGLSLTDPFNWRAVWALREAYGKGNIKLLPYLDEIIDTLPKTKEGHQREWLKTVMAYPLNEEQEGKMFDICLTLWEQPGKAPAIRHSAFIFLARVIKKYPELWNELAPITDEEYLDSLTPGVRHSVEKLLATLRR